MAMETQDRDFVNQYGPKIRRNLLRWFDKYKRDMPWRRRQDDPYAQLLAETMLQQTQVATVGDYFERFMARFPNVQALAAADIEEVLALWAGLGYYRRARHLHAAARYTVEHFDGRIPDTLEALLQLPGVGRYTAGAVASIAYGRRAPIVDGNVTRVLARLLAIAQPVQQAPVARRLWRLAEGLLPRKRVGDFNQGLMELGSLVCRVKVANCSRCPLRNVCRARAQGEPTAYPVSGPRTAVKAQAMIVVAIQQGTRLFFRRRPLTGLWAGLWELPCEPIGPGESDPQVRQRLRKSLPVRIRFSRKVELTCPWLLSHRRIEFRVFRGHVVGDYSVGKNSGYRWLTVADLGQKGISAACRRMLEQLDWL